MNMLDLTDPLPAAERQTLKRTLLSEDGYDYDAVYSAISPKSAPPPPPPSSTTSTNVSTAAAVEKGGNHLQTIVTSFQMIK